MADQGSLFSDGEILGGVTAYLRTEYPNIWNLACEYDYADRMSRPFSQLQAEAAAVMHELWSARKNAQVSPPGSDRSFSL